MAQGARGLALALLVTVPALSGCLGGDPLVEAGVEAAPGGDVPASVYASIGDGRVRIHRDHHGVPHVYADTEDALVWGNGYAQAQDRLFQMDLLRRAAEGRLSEVLGPAMLPVDERTRLLGRTEDARWRTVDALVPEDRAALAAFTDGVNAAMRDALLDPGKLPVEFAALGVAPEPWQATDTVAVAELAFATFGEFGGDDLANALLLADLEARLGEEVAWSAFQDHHPLVDPDAPVTAPPDEVTYPAPSPAARLPAAQRALLDEGALDAARVARDAEADAHVRWLGLGLPLHLGSNAIVVDGEHTASGRPLLLGGPQVGFSVPSLWWEVGLHGAGWDVAGVNIPGIPGVAIGRTARAAWTVTSGYTDNVDHVIVKTDPADPTRYEGPDGWATMHTRVETFHVRAGVDAAPVLETRVMHETPFGPVVARSGDGAHAIIRRSMTRGDALAGDVVVESLCWLRLGTTTSYQGFRDCFAEVVPNFNFLYADDEGVIAYHHVGRIPARDATLDPRFPLPGNVEVWTGVVPFSGMPQVVEPVRGWVSNWNNPPAAGWGPGDQQGMGRATHRGAELEAILAAHLATGPLTLEGLQQVNEDAATRDVVAPRFRDVVAAAPDHPVKDRLLAWLDQGAPIRDDDVDGRVDDDAVAAWRSFYANLTERVLGDDLGAHLRAPWYATRLSGNAASDGLGVRDDGLLWSVLTGRARHDWLNGDSLADVLAASLDDAAPALSAGAPMTQHAFAPMGAGSVDPFPRMNRGSYNQFVELTTPPLAVNVLPPGNSGLVTAAMVAGAASNPHLADQRDLYAAFAATPFPFFLPEVEPLVDVTVELDVVRGVQVPTRLPPAAVDAAREAGFPVLGVLGLAST